VFRAIRADSVLEARRILVGSGLGTVTLSGQVQSVAEKLRAQRIASRVPGVRLVRNRIEVVAPG